MRGRVSFTPPSYIGMSIDWNELVDKPFKEGRILEAFASADAIIDNFVESCLRQVYDDSKSQDLINEIHMLRGRVNFDGLILLEILKSKTVVDDVFVQKVRQFKLARNLCMHDQAGEYALVIGNPAIQYSSQEELDKAVGAESRKWISIAYEIFNDLTDVMMTTDKNKEYYFSDKFYQEHPRGKVAKQKFPKEPKK